MHVEAMTALAPDQWTVVSGHLAFSTTGVEGEPADTAGVVFGHPLPGAHRMPMEELHFQATPLFF